MPLRRSHPKSHHGCDQCRRRRVKCDEQQPACKNCVTRSQNCHYQSSARIKWASAPASGHIPGSVSLGWINRHTQLRTENIPIPLNAMESLYRMPSDVPRLGLSCEGVHLINNWFTSTIYTVTLDEASLRVCDIVTRDAAKAHGFLLHGMMALSAFQFAVQGAMPLRATYILNANQYLDHALEKFRPVIGDINATNATAIITFSSLITIICFASGRTQPRDFTFAPVDELLQVFGLIKYWFIVLTEASKHLNLASFIDGMHKPDPVPFSLYPGKTALDRLEELIIANGASTIASEKDSYKAAIQLLKLVLHRVHIDKSNPTVVMEWARKVPEEYFQLIKNRCPLALVILAHYSVALHYCDRIWWLKGWGRRVLLSVWHNLHPYWRSSIGWPMEIVGIE